MPVNPLIVLLFVLLTSCACSKSSAGERPQATYDTETGQLRTLLFDANHNGKNDSVSYMDGTRILRIELDLDENGEVERWDFYGPDRQLEKVGFSSRNDGVMDFQAFYSVAGLLQRMEISTKRDRRFDKIEFYEGNVLVRSEEDTNGDSRPDKWDTYASNPNARAEEPAYSITSTAFDDIGTGKPQRRFVYGPNGTVARLEIDSEGDGTFVPRSVGGSASATGR